MTDLWTHVDQYIGDTLIGEDKALRSASEASTAAGLPSIAVSPAQGKLLMLLARAIEARSILEIGTLGGYSSIWLARALAPGGRLVTLEASPRHADVARRNVDNAGVGTLVDIVVGKALDTLPRLEGHPASPFDFVFIDADKPNIPEYFTWSLQLAHPGSLIVIDNVVRKGALADASSTDADVEGVRKLHEMIAHERRVTATTIQTVGAKGYDGFTLALVQAS